MYVISKLLSHGCNGTKRVIIVPVKLLKTNTMFVAGYKVKLSNSKIERSFVFPFFIVQTS